MTGTNHALTGANIALITGQWWAVPAAVASHFLLDLLPHYGEDGEKGRRFAVVLSVDAFLLALLTLALAASGVLNLLVFLAMVGAVIPDSVWFYREYMARYKGRSRDYPLSFFNQMHKNIQWGERTWGWVLEISWFIAMMSVLALAIQGI